MIKAEPSSRTFGKFRVVLCQVMGVGVSDLAGASGVRPAVPSVRDRTRVSTAWMLFVVLAGLNLLDMIVTHVGLQRGVMREVNPLMREVVAHLWSAAAVKIVALAAVAGFVYLIRARPRVVHGTLALAIAWYLFVVTWNASIVLGIGH